MRLLETHFGIPLGGPSRRPFEAAPDGQATIAISSEGQVLATFPAPTASTRWTESGPMMVEGRRIIFGARYISGITSAVELEWFLDGLSWNKRPIEEFRAAAKVKGAGSLAFAELFVSWAPWMGLIGVARGIGPAISERSAPAIGVGLAVYFVAALVAANIGGRALARAKKSQQLVGLKAGLIALGVFVFCGAVVLGVFLGPLRPWLLVSK